VLERESIRSDSSLLFQPPHLTDASLLQNRIRLPLMLAVLSSSNIWSLVIMTGGIVHTENDGEKVHVIVLGIKDCVYIIEVYGRKSSQIG
jgi:hypothetical protein